MHGNASFPSVHQANVITQRLARNVLEQIALRSRLNGAVDIFVTIERRQHDNPRVLIVSPNLFDYASSIELRHAQIEHRHLRSMPLPKLDRFTSVTEIGRASCRERV